MDGSHVVAGLGAETAGHLLRSLLPQVDEKLLSGRAGEPDWPGNAGWEDWLLGLDAVTLHDCERYGLHRAKTPCNMPTDLRLLCELVVSASMALGRHGDKPTGECSCSCSLRQSAEKAVQVNALLSAVGARCDLSRVRRVVDVGCGKGHLTAALRKALGVPALGLDFDVGLLEAGRALYPDVTFEARDIVVDGLPCEAGDLVVGLHPCGCLGEAVVSAVSKRHKASDGRGAALLMVPCCWHKQRAPRREPLSTPCTLAELRLPHSALKKASMAMDASQSVPSRRARFELRELLRLRGVPEEELSQRREMDGIHPRKALRGLPVLAAEAFKKRSIHPPPSDMELQQAIDLAHPKFERSRRLSVLEPMLGEFIEIICTLDRALALHEAGLRTRVFQSFAAGASDRNLAILAEPAQQLPMHPAQVPRDAQEVPASSNRAGEGECEDCEEAVGTPPPRPACVPAKSSFLGEGALASVWLLPESSGFGTLWRSSERPSSQGVALKVLPKPLVAFLGQSAAIAREKQALEALCTAAEGSGRHCPYVIRVRFATQDADHVCLGMDAVLWALGNHPSGTSVNLEQLRQLCPQLPLSAVFGILACAASAVVHIHACGVVHRDLKPANFVLGRDGAPVLIDFGVARLLMQQESSDDGRCTSLVGTLPYVAPEVLSRSGHGYACDWWSLGVLLWNQMYDAPPFGIEGCSHASLAMAHSAAFDAASGEGVAIPTASEIRSSDDDDHVGHAKILEALLTTTFKRDQATRASLSRQWASKHLPSGANVAAGLAALRAAVVGAGLLGKVGDDEQPTSTQKEEDAEAAAWAREERETLIARAEAAWQRKTNDERRILFEAFPS